MTDRVIFTCFSPQFQCLQREYQKTRVTPRLVLTRAVFPTAESGPSYMGMIARLKLILKLLCSRFISTLTKHNIHAFQKAMSARNLSLCCDCMKKILEIKACKFSACDINGFQNFFSEFRKPSERAQSHRKRKRNRI